MKRKPDDDELTRNVLSVLFGDDLELCAAGGIARAQGPLTSAGH